MSADKKNQGLSEKRGVLQRLQENYSRLRAYLALATQNIEEPDKDRDRDSWARRGRVSKQTRTGGWRKQDAKKRSREGIEPQSEREVGKTAVDLLDRKIASYRSRIRRTSVQLLVAAAAGHQHRETNLATKQGGLIKGINPGILRKHRAFDVRPTPSLTSDEAAARAVKNWMNRRKAGLDSDTDSDGDDDGDDGSAMVKMVMAMMAQPIEEGSSLVGEKSATSSQTSNGAYHPAAEDPNVYDPILWKPFLNTDIDWLKDDIAMAQFKNLPDHTPIGPRTWREQEKAFPVLDSVFEMRRKDKSELWDPDTRIQEEANLSERPPLEADINTLLSLERQENLRRREKGAIYYEYSRVPLKIPDRLSEEEIRRGPLPTLPRLPLKATSGREVKLGRTPTPPFVSDLAERKRKFLNMTHGNPTPVAKFHYPVDSPTVSAFKLDDGRQVSDILKPGPLDEPHQVRGSQAIVDYGKEVENRIAGLKEAYHPEDLPPPPHPDFRPDGYGTNMTDDRKQEFVRRRRESLKKAHEAHPQAIRRERAARRAATSKQKETMNRPREVHPKNPFWHFEDVNDSESRLHNDGKTGNE
ncbi:uncharacterized protein GGS22DRAFT_192660 [Annulohypoxylon maeteangense]|uniref:uncharacterized protein n=1 Tax=Annulohypoxylon maeteangense TaxID=1927788 RepID=UPI002008B556|nr:uncharacterized protein GGS22DRAFT_192660 [Annulohypoxylon maeteangense]KAI0881173.1 hypothetical protein GGS22DRAFT_192660 [Annulohypoxylon maeteangense]